MPVAETAAPTSSDQAAGILAAAAAEGRRVRFSGSQGKIDWGHVVDEPDVELRTGGLSRIVEHNAGDLTATLEAGVTLDDAQRTFAAAGQMLALDPPLHHDQSCPPTVGGVLATGDSGPLRHRYGAPRDLVVGITVALSDGTIATAGGKVIKNVAGYDLPKLFAGSFGTLGLILSVNVRLHPRHQTTVSALGETEQSKTLMAAALALAAAGLEFEALDVFWRAGHGGLIARCAGPEAAKRGQRAARLMTEYGLKAADTVVEDDELWERQRSGQRSHDAALVRVSSGPADLGAVLAAAEAAGATLVGRAALGTSYLELDPEAVEQLRGALAAARSVTLLDGPLELRRRIDPWGEPGGTVDLMRRIKARFDPTGTCNPGLFVGGI